MVFCCLVLGGMSSGKSLWSLRYMSRYVQKQNNKITLIVTADKTDKNFSEKILQHKLERQTDTAETNTTWDVVEAPVNLIDAFITANKNTTCLIDSLDIWMNNIIFKHQDKDHKWIWDNYCQSFLNVLGQLINPVMLVSTEVGQGIIPIHKTGRMFIEIMGKLHQEIAKQSNNVFFIIAGKPIFLSNEMDFDHFTNKQPNIRPVK